MKVGDHLAVTFRGGGHSFFLEKGQKDEDAAARSPSSALLPFFGGRVPLLK